jgi:hypothetical protein
MTKIILSHLDALFNKRSEIMIARKLKTFLIWCILMAFMILMASCSETISESDIQTAIALTELARPDSAISPTPTLTPTYENTNTPIPTSTPTRTSTPSPTPTRLPLSESNLQQMLLELDDLPAGWFEETTADEEDQELKTATFLCKEYERRAVLRTSAEFKRGQIGPILGHAIAVYPYGTAVEQFAIFVSAVEECSEFTTSDNGETYDWKVSKISFPKLGEESFAIRVTTEFILGFMEIDTVQFRIEDVIVSITHMDFGLNGVDTAQTEVFARQAENKINTFFKTP